MAADRLSRAFAALADPLRRDMVARLAAGDATVNELAEPFTMSTQAISKHLKVLERAGLISRSKHAQWRPCQLEAAALDGASEWIDRYREIWHDKLDRLDTEIQKIQHRRSAPDTQEGNAQ